MNYIAWQLKSTNSNVYWLTWLDLKDTLLREESELQNNMKTWSHLLKKTQNLYICTGSRVYVNAPKMANATSGSGSPCRGERRVGMVKADFHFLLSVLLFCLNAFKKYIHVSLGLKRKQKEKKEKKKKNKKEREKENSSICCKQTCHPRTRVLTLGSLHLPLTWWPRRVSTWEQAGGFGGPALGALSLLTQHGHH